MVLSLIFLKYASDRFEERKQELVEQGLKEYIDTVEFYTAEDVLYLPEGCRWSFIMQNPKQPNIFQIVDDALSELDQDTRDTATRDEIEQRGWSLVPSKYIEFRNRDEQIDFDTKMRELQADMRELLQQEEKSKGVKE